MKTWQLQDAKARLSELLRQAQEAPQQITVRGEDTAIVLSRKDYDGLTGSKETLWKFLRDSPLKGLELDIERDSSLPRNVDL